MKDVLIVHPFNDYTGSTIALASFLISEKKHYLVVTRTDGVGALTNINNVDLFVCQLKHIRNPFISTLIYYSFMLRIIAKERNNCEYLLINTISPWLAAVFGKLFGMRIVYYIHETFVEKSFTNRLKVAVFEHIKAHCIFVSKYAMNFYDNKRHSVEIRYNKLRPGYLIEIPIADSHEGSPNRVLMISSLSISKGIGNFLAVATKLPEYKFQLLLSAEENAISSFFSEKRLEVPRNVQIIPRVADPRHIIINNDLLVNLSIPSLWVETFGLTLIEAMALGKPVVAPNIGGPCEIISDGVDGYLIDVTSIDVIARSIQLALTPNIYKRLAINALSKGLKFSYE